MHSGAALKIQMDLFIFDSFMFNAMHSAESAEVLMRCFIDFYQDHTWFTAQQNWFTVVPITFCVLLYIFCEQLYTAGISTLSSFPNKLEKCQCNVTAPFPRQLLFPEIQDRVRVLPALSCGDYWMWPLNRVSSADLTVYPSQQSYVPSAAGEKEPPVWLLLSDLWCCALLDPIV